MKKIVILNLLVILSILVACGNDNGVTESVNDSNSPPVITELKIPDGPIQGGCTIALEVVASDPDGDPLKFEWAVTDGKLSDFSLPAIEWITPKEEKKVRVTINIRDGINESAFEERYVEVIYRDYIRAGEGMAGLRLLGPYSQAINLYGQPESKTAVDFSYEKLGIKGELDGAGRIWVIHIVEPNKSVSKNGNGIGSARQDVQIEFGKPNRTFSDDDDYIWDGYFSENEFENKICFYELYFKYKRDTETVSSVVQAMGCARQPNFGF